MSSQPSLPKDPRLARVAEELERTRGAAVIHDAQTNVVWVSEELKEILRERDEEKLGYGKNMIEAYLSETWAGVVTEDTQIRLFVEEFPYIVWDMPGGKDRAKEIIRSAFENHPECLAGGMPGTHVSVESVEQLIDAIEPIEPPLIRTGTIEFVQADLPPMAITEVHVRLFDEEGTFVGTVALNDPGLPARVLALVARGDEDMFLRMAKLVDPGRRKAAIVFADLQSSAALSRRLPSAAYFKLIRAITTAVDAVVCKHQGIVGKHAGDGVTAFFLADDIGSASGAASAAIATAKEIGIAAGTAAKEVGDETGLIEASDCLINVGVHWGGTLYMGQLVTGGRLEVTALGDEVNECARIQQAARDGEVLASKSVIEHLSESDARELGFDPDLVLYRTVGELPGAPEKSVKDAGGISVTPL